MSTKLEALVDTLKAEGVEEEIIEQLIVDYFTRQNLSEYDVNGETYEVLTSTEVDNQLYDFATVEAEDLKEEMEELFYKNRNYLMVEMLQTLNEEKCIDIVKESYDDDTLAEKDHKSLILDVEGYFVYLKD